MWYQLKSYFRFLHKSSNQHGVHSPFVYQLITECFYDRSSFEDYRKLDAHRTSLLSDQATISVADSGAGSRVFKSDVRAIQDIAKLAGIRKKRQRLLYRLFKYLKIEAALELGTSVGLATAAMGLANPSARIITVEGCVETSKVAQKYSEELGVGNVIFEQSSFDNFLMNHEDRFDLVFVDGDHDKENTLRYFDLLKKKCHDHSVIIFDDIYWSPGMTEAWNTIIASEDITVSIDTFKWGLVFFRKEQGKQHFTIRV